MIRKVYKLMAILGMNEPDTLKLMSEVIYSPDEIYELAAAGATEDDIRQFSLIELPSSLALMLLRYETGERGPDVP